MAKRVTITRGGKKVRVTRGKKVNIANLKPARGVAPTPVKKRIKDKPLPRGRGKARAAIARRASNVRAGGKTK